MNDDPSELGMEKTLLSSQHWVSPWREVDSGILSLASGSCGGLKCLYQSSREKGAQAPPGLDMVILKMS